ncbi:MAG: hypothetical protein NVSMB63_12320 [Sediminibacterium sp.]
MKRIMVVLLLMLVLVPVVVVWLSLGPGTGFDTKSKYFIITEDRNGKAAVQDILNKNSIIKYPAIFSILGNVLGIWHKLIPGKYEVRKGQSLLSIARMLKNGRLAEIKLVINKLRTKEDLARLTGRNFSTDSASTMQFLQSNDSLQPYGVDTNTVFTMIIPDTYTFYWNTPLNKIFRKLADTKEAFWQKNNRLQQAENMGFSPVEVYTLASITEEETNYESDKYKIASVYINRLNQHMPLQACPTIKYAMKDFSLTRIYEKYLNNPSPYNTYHRKGLPPGPICTPSPKTIDIILNAPRTNYLFFVAKSDFSGYHHFSDNFAEHSQYAKEYQKALDAYMARKQQTRK